MRQKNSETKLALTALVVGNAFASESNLFIHLRKLGGLGSTHFRDFPFYFRHVFPFTRAALGHIVS